jgi:hypothetical protein
MRLQYTLFFVLTACMAVTYSCKSKGKSALSENKTDSNKAALPAYTKPPSSYSDTIIIDNTAAVFYHPDSLQLKKIEALIDKRIFESQMHEYFYQMRNSRIVLKNSWSSVKIIEAKNIRYLFFKKIDTPGVLIDLNSKTDPYGLFLFDGIKDPYFADMMNIETELFRYFPK